jgi:hypothetical protein
MNYELTARPWPLEVRNIIFRIFARSPSKINFERQLPNLTSPRRLSGADLLEEAEPARRWHPTPRPAHESRPDALLRFAPAGGARLLFLRFPHGH